MARNRKKQIAQFLGRQSPLPGMTPSRGRVGPVADAAISGRVNNTGNVRQGQKFELVVKDGRIFHNYGKGQSFEVGPAVENRHVLGPHNGRFGLGAGMAPPPDFDLHGHDMLDAPREVRNGKGRKKLVKQFMARNTGTWKGF